ncbi:MAG TPA: DUF5069 domain-containing protein [Oscillatoriaceae cyanobacterium]
MSETPNTSWTPRSPFAEVGGYVWLPRLLDKCRHVTSHPDATYMSLDASFLDQQFLRSLGLTSTQIVEWVREGLSDEAIAARVAEHCGHDATAIAAWSDRFTRQWKLVFVAFDADEGRMAPGLRQAFLKAVVNALFTVASTLQGHRPGA